VQRDPKHLKARNLHPDGQWYKDGPGWTGPRRACAAKEPLEPRELSPATNPRYADDWKEYIDCARAAGVDVTPIKTEFGNDVDVSGAKPGVDVEKVFKECELKAFSN
jgi:hypothetical protein